MCNFNVQYQSIAVQTFQSEQNINPVFYMFGSFVIKLHSNREKNCKLWSHWKIVSFKKNICSYNSFFSKYTILCCKNYRILNSVSDSNIE